VTFRQVGIDEARRLRDEGYRVVDVREPVEWASGRIAGATHIPLGDLPSRMTTDLPNREEPLLLYCRSGARSGRASAFLAANGYATVANLDALVSHWKTAGAPWEEDGGTPAEPGSRYARQILIPEVGTAGQRRLRAARILVVGAGGLGSPAALYLAAAGVGTIGIVDDDAVEESNLQRQVLHRTEDVGRRKVDSAERSLRALNPETAVIKHDEHLDAGSVDRLIGGYDVIVDGSDTLDTRYVLNDAAVRLRKPVVHASVYRWEGLVTTFVPFEGPCYRCLYPVQPPDELAPACDVAGVMGVLPGIAGVLQATEVLKLLLGAGQTLMGRLLTFDARAGRFEEVTVPRDPACPSCGSSAT
jgi:molybdopterin/thiamine biosynthesis adenylyltransferase/rhodanese-related sulfurtransferase